MPIDCASATPFSDGLVAAVPRLRAFARLLSKDPDLADDLVQDTLAQALANQHTFRPGTSQAAWLSTILRNRFFGIRRRAKIASFVNDDIFLENVSVPAAQDDTLAIADLQEALLNLPADQRDLVLGFTFGDLTYKEAATHFGCSIGTIKSRLSRARAVLRDAVYAASE